MDTTISNEYILLILNCKKYAHKAAHQKATWLPEITSFLPYYHIIGDELLEEDFKFDNHLCILYVRVVDDYISLPKKVLAAFNAIIRTFPECKYILKTDDDQMLSTPDKFFKIITSIIETKKPKVHYAGKIIEVKTPYLSEYGKIHPELPAPLIVYPTKYCNGRFYALSVEAVKSLLQRRNLIEKEFLEDYAVGYYLHPIFKMTAFNIDSDRFFTDF